MAETTDKNYLDPQVINKIGKLELRARLMMEGFVSGMHKSPFKGFSVEFAQHREYVPGDDIRYIDWKVYGRSDRFYIKDDQPHNWLVGPTQMRKRFRPWLHSTYVTVDFLRRFSPVDSSVRFLQPTGIRHDFRKLRDGLACPGFQLSDNLQSQRDSDCGQSFLQFSGCFSLTDGCFFHSQNRTCIQLRFNLKDRDARLSFTVQNRMLDGRRSSILW